MRALLAVLAVIGSAASAEVSYWDYGDWTVMVETRDTGQDLRITCNAWTGGDGMPSLRIALSNGDALPPYVYPVPHLVENAPRHYSTVMQDGQRVLFEFDWDWRTEGYVTGGIDDSGLAWAQVGPHPGDARAILQVMRQAGTMWTTLDGDIVYEASLNGFTAAYGKLAEQCGFPTTGVID